MSYNEMMTVAKSNKEKASLPAKSKRKQNHVLLNDIFTDFKPPVLKRKVDYYYVYSLWNPQLSTFCGLKRNMIF